MKGAKSGAKLGFGSRLLCWGIRVLNIGLGLFLFVQVILLVVLLKIGEIPVPEFVIEKLERKLAVEGVKVELSSVELDLRGVLLLRGVKLGLNEYSEYLVETDLVLLHFPPWALFSGSFMPDEVWVSHCQLFCPAVLSPTGQREAVADDIYSEIKISRDEITLERLLLRVGSLDAVIRGTMVRPQGELAKEDDEELDGHSLAETYSEVCHAMLGAHTWLKRFTEPELWISLRIEEEESRAYMRLQTQDFNLGNGAEGKHVVLKALGAGRGPDNYQLRRVMFQVRDVAWKEEVSAGSLQAIARLPEQSKQRWPQTLNIGGHDLQGGGLSLSAFSGKLNLADIHRPEGTLYLQDGTNWMNVNGWVDTEKETADVAVDAFWDPTYFFSSSLLGDKAKFPDLECQERPRWGARVYLDEHYAFDHLDVTVDFGKTRLESLQLESVYAEGSGSPDKIAITKAILATDRYSIEGSYFQNLKTNHYRFLVRGHLDPIDIDFIVDEDWWAPLWKRFEYHGQLPYANLDLSGYYGGGTKDKFFFGYNEFWDFSYNGIPMDGMSAMLWRSPLQLTLYDMKGHGKDGDFNGTLQFNYTEKGDDRKSLAFAVASTLPLNEAAELVGPEAIDIAKEFRTTAPPELQVTGLIFGEDSDQPPGDLYLNIHGTMDSQVTYEGFVFDHVDFDAVKSPDAIHLPDFTFGMAQGSGTGDAKVTLHSDEHRTLEISINMKDAKYLLLKEAVPFFDDGAETEHGAKAVTKSAESLAKTKQNEPKKLAQEAEALVDLEMSVGGTLGELDSFNGYGRFKIREAFLGQLHLFGGLSRVVQSVGLNLGTLEFTHGHAPFLMGQGYLYFPNLVVGGDTAKVKANGNLKLGDDTLNFYVSLYPLGGINVPIVSQIFSIINPLTNTIESHLTGTVQEPNWDVGISLGAVFSGQEKVENLTGQSFPKGFLDE